MSSAAKQQFFRFMAMGALSTAVTYVIYVLLSLYFNYQFAYFCAYMLGIVLSYYLNVLFVFDTKISLRTFVRFPLVYVIQYLISALFLGILVEKLLISTIIAPVLILVITLPLSFVLSRYILSRY
jgi:putative flippase GtrA